MCFCVSFAFLAFCILLHCARCGHHDAQGLRHQRCLGRSSFDLIRSQIAIIYIYICGYGSIPIDTFLVGWTSISQLFWGSLGYQGFDSYPYIYICIYTLYFDLCDIYVFSITLKKKSLTPTCFELLALSQSIKLKKPYSGRIKWIKCTCHFLSFFATWFLNHTFCQCPGYVQRNLSFLPRQRLDFKATASWWNQRTAHGAAKTQQFFGFNQLNWD